MLSASLVDSSLAEWIINERSDCIICGRIWELYKMIKTSQVRWVFELKKMDSTEEFSELAHIIERKD